MRFLKVSALIVVVCLLLTYLALILSPFLSAPVKDQDLASTRKAVTAEANGFTALESAVAQRWWPEDQATQLDELASGTNWDGNLAELALTKNLTALQSYDAVLAAPEFQVPEFQFDDGLAYLSDWKGIARLAMLRANADFRAGQEAEAFKQAADLVRLGGRMEQSGGAIIHYLVGAAVRGVGLAAIRSWIPTTRLDAAQLSGIARELRKQDDNAVGLTNALKAEYQFAISHLKQLREGKLSGPNAVPLASSRILPVYNEPRTKRKFAEQTRKLIAAASLPFSEGKAAVTDPRTTPLRMIFSGNLVGEVMFAMTVPAVQSVVSKKCQLNNDLEVTATLLALRAYQQKHGRLPEQLEMLVPEFLDAAPQDEFDGKPLRYDSARKLLYSVGADGKDDGGVETDRRKHEPDYVFLIPF